MEERKLTPKQNTFVYEYMKDSNATRAYKAAYPSCKKDDAASVNGSLLLGTAKVQAAIAELTEAKQASTLITVERDLLELGRIAFADIGDILEFRTENVVVDETVDPITGETTYVYKPQQIVILKDSRDIPKDKRAAIQSVKMGRNGPEIVMVSKIQALELIAKHLGMLVEKRDITADITISVKPAPEPPAGAIDQADIIDIVTEGAIEAAADATKN